MRIPNCKFGLRLAPLQILLIATGCAHYQAQPISIVDVAEVQNRHSVDAPCIQAAHADALNPDALEYTEAQLVAAAECFNPELARAKAATQLALNNGELAKQYPGLMLVLNAEYARNAPESSKWLAGFSVDLALDFGTRRAVRIEAAAQMHVLAALDYALAQRAVAGKIAASVDAIRASIAERALLQSRKLQSQNWLKFVDQRILEGQATRPERLKPQQDLLMTQSALLRALANERAARSQLAQALGVPLAQVLNLHLVRPSTKVSHRFVDESADSAIRQAALLGHPELLRALGQYQLAEAALRLEYAKQYPELRLAPGYIWERGLVKLPLALAALLPPLDGNRSEIAVATAARSLAARELELTQANINAEIDLAFANRAAARDAWALGMQEAQIATSELSAANAAFATGELDQLGRLSAELHLNDLLIAAHTLDVQLQLSERAVALALGALPSKDIK